MATNAGSAFVMALTPAPPLEFQAATGPGAAAPLWAGVIALADQEAGHRLNFVNPAIYAITRSSSYRRAFHDVITGDNSEDWQASVFFAGYKAGSGWDPVTGWGSPNTRHKVSPTFGTSVLL